jgi:LPXTG-motif cell wall-anchored protein
VVTCTKCGVENKDDAKFCSGCGVALGYMEQRSKPRDECFGLPHGGAIFGLFIGAIIIIWGLSSLFDLQVELGTYAILIFGILIVAGAIYGLTRKKR